jgi:elongation factor G
MKVYKTNEIKNIALIGNSGSGKTTFAEAMLFESGLIRRRGTIEGKNTVSDYFPVEKEYEYSVFPSVISYEWKDKLMNFIDCPGSDDFVGGVVTALNVTDLALMLIDAADGVEVGTINQFRYVDELKKPAVILVNGMDHEKADYSPKDIVEISKSISSININGKWHTTETTKKTKDLFKKLKIDYLTT